MERKKMIALLVCNMFAATLAISSQWTPVIPAYPSASLLHQEAAIYGEQPLNSYPSQHTSVPETHPLAQQEQDQCALYKVGMNQQLYFERIRHPMRSSRSPFESEEPIPFAQMPPRHEAFSTYDTWYLATLDVTKRVGLFAATFLPRYIHYKTDLPDLKEFTLCSWTKFHNHTNDHPIFSYAVDDQPRAILSWVANTARSSYFMLNVAGHNLYRLNYPLRLNKWYHTCQSWNGRTGEWQIWVNDERVGRGFHNSLVGHTIKGGGVAITGQEQRQVGGGFLEGAEAPAGSGGFLGEITMLQLYSVALTAGKAHKDHKHHHAHHYEHKTDNNTPQPTTKSPVTGRPLVPNPFLTAGQINHRVKINTGAPLQVNQNGLTLRYPVAQPATSFLPLPPPNDDSTNQLPSGTGITNLAGGTTQFFGNQLSQVPQSPQIQVQSVSGFPGFVETQFPNLYKREVSTENVEGQATKSVTKRETKVSFVPAARRSSEAAEKVVEKRDSDKKKRGLVQLTDGTIIDDTYLGNQGLDNDYFSGLASFGLHLPAHQTKDEEREPAEAEVAQVMNVCDGCAEDPFEKALVLGWRTVPKKLYSGALYLPAAQTCRGF